MPLLLFSQATPDTRGLFFISLVTVSAVILFATGVIVLLLRRMHRRRVEEGKLAAMGQAAIRILHQVKNPLQSVMLQTELLQSPAFAEDPGQRTDACDAIINESARLTAMLNELGLWATGSRRVLNVGPIRLDELLHQLIRTERAESETRGVRLETTEMVEATVSADPYYLRQAIENIVRNAREAVAERSDGVVRLELRRAGAAAQIRIADNGPGIPREQLASIFEPFVSSKGMGMGLGLPICKEIIEGHGGRLEVQSKPGSGSVFLVTLPLHQDRSNKGARERGPAAPRGAASGESAYTGHSAPVHTRTPA